MLILLICVSIAPADAATRETLKVAVRGTSLTLALYLPPPEIQPKGTILMASGDAGWLGLAATVAPFLADNGYIVAGINSRQYLGAFTNGTAHLAVTDIPGDFRAIAEALRTRGRRPLPVLVSGVSEGAALAVAAASEANRDWVDGVITLGLPAEGDLAWHWNNVLTWITKSDANEPSFPTAELVGRIAPTPLYMLQSKQDEWVTEGEYRRIEAAAQPPVRFVLIEASNHSFSDRRDELWRQLRTGLSWIGAQLVARAAPPGGG